MVNVVYFWKPVGVTPLQLINDFKEKHPEYKNETISYAGRLDPMAEGILVLLIGEENKNRDKYLGLDKEYESEIVLGVSTDTFDSLGLITNTNIKDVSKKDIEESLKNSLGKQKQIYPPYSSRTIEGKPLFWWAREKRLDEIELPTREIEIYSSELIGFENITVEKMTDHIIDSIKKVEGVFRQEDIIREWEKFHGKYTEKEFLKIKIKVNCSTGTYIRRLADDLGKDLETSAFAYSIKRTKVGNINLENCLRL